MARPMGKVTPMAKEKAKMGPFERVREERQEIGVEWRDVSDLELRAALQTALAQGVTVVFSSAMGGLGVCVRTWHGDDKDVAYAKDASMLNRLLAAMVDSYESPAEDARQSLRRRGQVVESTGSD